MDEIDYLAEASLEQIVDRLTDLVFIQIEQNAELRFTYNQLSNLHSEEVVNAKIGKYVRGRLALDNIGRCNNPESSLIQSYERHSMGARSL